MRQKPSQAQGNPLRTEPPPLGLGVVRVYEAEVTVRHARGTRLHPDQGRLQAGARQGRVAMACLQKDVLHFETA